MYHLTFDSCHGRFFKAVAAETGTAGKFDGSCGNGRYLFVGRDFKEGELNRFGYSTVEGWKRYPNVPVWWQSARKGRTEGGSW